MCMSSREVKLVGILNTTPDSFSDGGRYVDPETALERAYGMFQDGASMIDVGGESTRPGAEPIPHDEEYRRIAPILHALIPSYTESISVDTYHPETVRRIAAEIGPFVVNDVTGMNNPAMREAVAELGLPCIVSHLPSSAGQDIQKAHNAKPVDSLQQVVDELSENIDELTTAGVEPRAILVDPGFGFGKEPQINAQLLELPKYMGPERFNYYIGVSRKSSLRRHDFCGEELADFSAMDKEETEAWLDSRSVEVARVAIDNGFTYLRVHNVAAHAVLL